LLPFSSHGSPTLVLNNYVNSVIPDCLPECWYIVLHWQTKYLTNHLYSPSQVKYPLSITTAVKCHMELGFNIAIQPPFPIINIFNHSLPTSIHNPSGMFWVVAFPKIIPADVVVHVASNPYFPGIHSHKVLYRHCSPKLSSPMVTSGM
jgi:hypothetical protein